jgi:membrane-bound lytic murein transglycosylase A
MRMTGGERLPPRGERARRARRRPRRVLRGLALAGAVWGAATAGPSARALADAPPALRPVDGGPPPGLLDDGDPASLRAAIRQSLAWLERQLPGRVFAVGPRRVTAAEQAALLRRVLALLADDPGPEELEARVLAEVDVLASTGRDDGAVLVTGYHEPVIAASERRTAAYPVPIPGIREDRAPARWRDRRYPTRAEIAAGRLGEAARPLAWARDPVDVFVMEVEGSATLRFPDGREVRVGPAATNGRPYRSIGRLLIDEGRLTEETVSMHAIRSWLSDNPAHRERVLRHNESVVFFRRLEGPPLGSLGVPITPGRSVAVDMRVFPPGALAFLRTERPRWIGDGRPAWVPVSRFVLNQDAGGAVRGPGRVDVFWGRSADAELAASEMKQLGDYYVLLPRAVGGVAGPPAGR